MAQQDADRLSLVAGRRTGGQQLGDKRTTNDERRTTSSDGFTIVEVLIVLAIAGIIMLLVFQAIPTLSRNSRNNQRKQDVAMILAAISRYELNNSARFPLVSQLSLPNLSYYTTGDINIAQAASNKLAPTGPTAINTVNIYDYLRCDPTVPGKANYQGSDYSNIVALYAVETGGGSTGQCQQL